MTSSPRPSHEAEEESSKGLLFPRRSPVEISTFFSTSSSSLAVLCCVWVLLEVWANFLRVAWFDSGCMWRSLGYFPILQEGGPRILRSLNLVCTSPEEYRKFGFVWEMTSGSFRILCNLRLDTGYSSRVSLRWPFGRISFYVKVNLACRGPCSASWCRLGSTRKLDSSGIDFLHSFRILRCLVRQ